MATLYYRLTQKHIKKKNHSTSPALLNAPQARGSTLRVRLATPRKPNSARRPIAKISLVNLRKVNAHIPGVGHNVRKHSTVLIRGGGARDLPGINYTCVRGAYDLLGVQKRLKRRSVYGISKPDHLKNKIRRKFRNV